MIRISLIALWMLFALCLSAGEMTREMRVWTSSVGSTLEAKLLRASGDRIVLLRQDGGELTVRLDQLSPTDREYVAKATEVRGSDRIDGVDAEPGRISRKIACLSEPEWHYYLYLPQGFHDARKWPVWFIMSPGGGSQPDSMKRYIDGAERLGCILAFSVESKNEFADSDCAMEAMVKDVYERLPVAEKLAFATGMSGGSRMAYLLAERERHIAGVLACGSGSGVYIKEKDFRDAKLRSSTYVYSLIGTNGFNRTGAYRSHADFPDDYRLRFFPGNHDWAGPRYIAEGMARVLGAGLERYREDGDEQMRRDYARTLLLWAQEKVAEEPWEAYYFADYLKAFPAPAEFQGDAVRLARDLEADPKVQLALKAERELRKFGRKHFDVFYTEDKKPNAERKQDAERLAPQFEGTPYAELFRRLGDPSR